MVTSIMVPVDGSHFGEQAFPLAAGLARLSGARLQLVHVHGSTEATDEGVLVPVESLDHWEAEVRQSESLYLKDAGERLLGTYGVQPTLTLLGGRVIEALEAHAAASDVDLVVMSTHGRGGLARAWLGSVADGLLRRLSIPLLLVKPAEAVPPVWREPFFQRMLVPLDGSSAAEAVLEPALRLAALLRAECRFIVVVPGDAAVSSAVAAGAVGVAAAEPRDGAAARARAYLARVCEEAAARGVRGDCHVVGHSSPAAAILQEVAASGCDVIAIASHGRGGPARLLLGSVSDKVIRAAPIPVLVQRIPRMKVLPLHGSPRMGVVHGSAPVERVDAAPPIPPA